MLGMASSRPDSLNSARVYVCMYVCIYVYIYMYIYIYVIYAYICTYTQSVEMPEY